MLEVQHRIEKKTAQDMSFPSRDSGVYTWKHTVYKDIKMPYTPTDTSFKWPKYFEIPLNYLWNILNILRFK